MHHIEEVLCKYIITGLYNGSPTHEVLVFLVREVSCYNDNSDSNKPDKYLWKRYYSDVNLVLEKYNINLYIAYEYQYNHFIIKESHEISLT